MFFVCIFQLVYKKFKSSFTSIIPNSGSVTVPQVNVSATDFMISIIYQYHYMGERKLAPPQLNLSNVFETGCELEIKMFCQIMLCLWSQLPYM